MAGRKGTVVRGVKTFDVDIAQEFHELRKQNSALQQDVQSLKDTINGWKSSFDRQLDKLNSNMERVLNQIADHEMRLTNLELKARDCEVEKGVWAKVKKASFNSLVWFFWAGVVVSAAYGVKPALKVFNLFAN